MQLLWTPTPTSFRFLRVENRHSATSHQPPNPCPHPFSQIWDTAGEEKCNPSFLTLALLPIVPPAFLICLACSRYASMAPIYYRNASVAILVYDVPPPPPPPPPPPRHIRPSPSAPDCSHLTASPSGDKVQVF
jgi:hypothetical protein